MSLESVPLHHFLLSEWDDGESSALCNKTQHLAHSTYINISNTSSIFLSMHHSTRTCQLYQMVYCFWVHEMRCSFQWTGSLSIDRSSTQHNVFQIYIQTFNLLPTPQYTMQQSKPCPLIDHPLNIMCSKSINKLSTYYPPHNLLCNNQRCLLMDGMLLTANNILTKIHAFFPCNTAHSPQYTKQQSNIHCDGHHVFQHQYTIVTST